MITKILSLTYALQIGLKMTLGFGLDKMVTSRNLKAAERQLNKGHRKYDEMIINEGTVFL